MSEKKMPERLETIFRDWQACGYESNYTLDDMRAAILEAIEEAELRLATKAVEAINVALDTAIKP